MGAGNYGAALDMVDQWDDLFPTDKLNGQTFFWRGKVLLLRGQPREAPGIWTARCGWVVGGISRPRRVAAGRVAGADGQGGRVSHELARLIKTGLDDEFTKKAKDKLLKK